MSAPAAHLYFYLQNLNVYDYWYFHFMLYFQFYEGSLMSEFIIINFFFTLHAFYKF